MPFIKIALLIHRWLGLISGLIVCFLGITGCILCFQKEVERRIMPGQDISNPQGSFLPPSQLKAAAESSLREGLQIQRIEYRGTKKTAMAFYYGPSAFFIVYIDPYSGEVKYLRDMNRDFFRTVLNGHYNLWLPPAIGQPIVASTTLVFVIMLCSGFILWWPKTRAAISQRFSIQWKAGCRKINYQLHNVLGLYIMPVMIVIACTGLVMGFQWFGRATFFISSLGRSLPAFPTLVSDTVNKTNSSLNERVDFAWKKYITKISDEEGIAVSFPNSSSATINISINHEPGTYSRMDNYYLDQYTLNPLPVSGVYTGKFSEAGFPEKLVRMNYDLHVGSIGGLPTKIIVFLAALITASLPVTGFIIWLGRRAT